LLGGERVGIQLVSDVEIEQPTELGVQIGHEQLHPLQRGLVRTSSLGERLRGVRPVRVEFLWVVERADQTLPYRHLDDLSLNARLAPRVAA
jgi:hypothetical protein